MTDPRILTGPEAKTSQHRLNLWDQGKKLHPCPECHGVGVVKADNMWGVINCAACIGLPGVDARFHKEYLL